MLTHRRRPMLLGIGLVSLLAMGAVGCGPSSTDNGDSSDDDNVSTLLTISPATASLRVVDGAPVTQAFTVSATLPDGSVVDVTDTASIQVSDVSIGTTNGGVFTAGGGRGGAATLVASLDGASGMATYTVNLLNHRVDPSAPAGAVDMFGDGATEDAARAPTIVYPPNNVTMPPNLGDFDVHWADAVGNDVFEVRLTSEFADMRVYTSTNPRWIAFTPAEWDLAATGSEQVSIGVRAAATGLPGVVGSSITQTVTLSDSRIQGGLYYWAASNSSGGAYGVFRHDVDKPGQPAEPFYTTADLGGRCVACHALSRDGTRMAVTYDGGNGASATLDVASITATPSAANWNFAAFTADNQRLIGASLGVMSVRDPNSGAILSTIPTAGPASHPDVAPDDSLLAYTVRPNAGQADFSFFQGSIWTQPMLTDGTFGTPTSLVASTGPGDTNFYPAFSPDTAWVAFNRSSIGADTSDADCYDDAAAELWVVPTAGGSPIRMDAANVGPGYTNSWPRWAPFEQSVRSERMYWFTFSSKRDFGVRLVGTSRPQLWMAPFFPDRAAAGMDPSGPAFRLPFQNIETSNHIAQWTEQIVVVN